MTEFKGTPGPWRKDTANRVLAQDNRETIVCEVTGAPSNPTSQADGYMLAASLDMFEALKAVEKLINEALPQFNWGASYLDGNAIRLLNETPLTVRAAIAKALGEGQ